MIFKVILLKILIQNILAQCVTGCLKCLNNMCLSCDVYSQYVLQGGTCVQISAPNCQSLLNDGTCLLCALGYYYNLNTLNCIKVSKVITQCSSYDSTQSCRMCSTGFFLQNQNCTAVPQLIPNCNLYKSPTLCNTCNAGFGGYLCSPNQIQNCALYSQIKCNSCAPGYVMNQNYYFKTLLNFSNTTTINTLYTQMQNPSTVYIKQILCEQVTVKNCAQYLSFNQCAICNSKFYLDENQNCQPFPISQIQNCQIYKSAINCQQCQQGFYFGSPNNCNLITVTQKIAGCFQYDSTQNTIICSACTSKFFLKSNSCYPRAYLLINNCAIYNLNSDTCLNCGTNYINSSDNLACFPSILNCESYLPANSTASTQVCSGCIEGHYMDQNNNCILGTISNCKIYLNILNCLKCNFGFYLNNSECFAQAQIPRCLNYSPTLKNTCTDCQQGSISFFIEQACVPVTPIPNCQIYNSDNTCNICLNNFYLMNGNCVSIPIAFSNCLQFSNQQQLCILCASNFVIQNGFCYLPEIIVTNNCIQTNIQSPNSQITFDLSSCNSCALNTLPHSLQGTFQCILASNLLPRFGIKIINNCIRYDQNKLCQVCSEGFYLQSNSCINVCTGTYSIIKINQTLGQFNVISMKECLINPISGTAVVAPLINSDFSLTAVQCNSNAFPLIQFPISVQKHLFSPNVQNSQSYFIENSIQSPVSFWPVQICVPIQNNNTPSPNQFIKNCIYYTTTTTNIFKCARCSNGMTGVVGIDGFMSSCMVSIGQCDNQFTEGLDRDLNAIVSCYTCFNGRIPVLYWNQNQSVFHQFGLNGNAIACIIPLVNITPNCAIVVQSSILQNGANILNPNQICVACKPGFKLLSGSNGVTCDNSSFNGQCSFSNWFNYCTTCSTAYTFNNIQGIVQFDSCEQIKPVSNCLTSYFNGTNSICKQCLLGYSLNWDKVCEILNTPACEVESTNLNQIQTDIVFMILNRKFTKGCTTCNSTYVPILINTTTTSCLNSTYYTNLNQNTTQITQYIFNCVSYYARSPRICLQCANNYIVSSSRINCVSKTGVLLNCQIANINLVQCDLCLKGFTFAPNCVLGSIQGCQVFLPSLSSVQKCSICKPGLFLSADQTTCSAGMVPNCSVYANGNPNVCTSCLPASQMIYLKNNVTYCFAYGNSLNLTGVDYSFQKQIINASCDMVNFIHTNSTILIQKQNYGICLPLMLIQFCLNYDFQSKFSDSSLRCSQCKSNYFVNSIGFCSLRQNIITGCVTLNPSLDNCLACLPGRYLLPDGSACNQFPTGIPNCNNYQDNQTCIGCNTNYFFQQNQCTLVANLTQNCLSYSSPNNCQSCVPGFILNGNSCNPSTNQNCQSFGNDGVCSVCNTGSIMDENNNCVDYPDTNCIQIQQNPLSCLYCVQGYYLSITGVCTSADGLIPNCTNYSSNTTCTLCAQGTVLVGNQSCVLNVPVIDPNCFSSQAGAPVCAMCNPGYYFQNQTCTVCPNTTSNSVGCLSCDPVNINNCIMCLPGYFQNNDTTCSLAVISITASNSTNSNLTNDTSISYTASVNTQNVTNNTKSSCAGIYFFNIFMIVLIFFKQ